MAEEKNARWKVLQLRGLRKRWIFNTVMPVLALLVLIVVLFSTGVSSYYYQSMEDGLTKQVQAQAGAFNDYFMDNGYTSYYQKAVQCTPSLYFFSSKLLHSHLTRNHAIRHCVPPRAPIR